MTARFELDETKAAGWLAAQMAAYEAWLGGATLPDLTVDSGYSPARDDEGSDTGALVSAACDAGLVAGPGEIGWDYTADPDGCGYSWLVYLTGPGGVRLTSCYEDMRYLGDADAEPGVPAALAVLREAVTEANRLLDGLDAYIAAQTAPQPA